MARRWLMKRVLIAAALLGAASPALAHPGWGIVRDSRGNIYYTDLEHVWRLAPDGTKSIAVRGVHTHELYVDAGDSLFGEHLWYEGEATDRWGYRVWRMARDGEISTVIPPTEGFRSDYSFVRDAAGNMYWHDKGVVHRRSSAGADAVLNNHRFVDIRSMTAAAGGDLYLIDQGALYRVTSEGQVRRVAANLAESSPTMPFVGVRHQLMGLWLDQSGNVYVAAFGGQKVKRVSPVGNVEVVARTTSPWSPTGGLVAPDGSLWLLEYSLTNQARVRNANRPESGRPTLHISLVAAGALAFAVGAYALVRRRLAI